MYIKFESMKTIDRIIHKLKLVWYLSPLGKVCKDKDAVTWGIIGTGYMANVFAQTITRSKTNRLVAVASRTLSKAKCFADRFKVEHFYGSYDDMLENKTIDVIYVATPVDCHFENVRSCLMAGFNVLCEKPLVTRIDQMKELIDIAETKHCFLMEGMWMKCLPTFSKAHEWISDGYIGDTVLVKADLYKRTTLKAGNHRKSVITDYGEYPLAFIHTFLSDSELVSVESIQDRDGIDTDWCLIFKDGEKKGIVNLSGRFASLSKAAVIGTEGSIEWESQFNRTNIISLYDKSGRLIDKCEFKYLDEGFEYELDEVCKCIKRHETECELVQLNSTEKTVGVIDTLLKRYK